MTKTEQLLLERCEQGPVSFTHAADIKGRYTRLVRSTISPSQQKHLHELAVAGYVAERVSGCGGLGTPPESTVTYSLTALGRSVLGIRAPTPVPIHRTMPLTDEELELEGIE